MKMQNFQKKLLFPQGRKGFLKQDAKSTNRKGKKLKSKQ